jgi:hypothetical protein
MGAIGATYRDRWQGVPVLRSTGLVRKSPLAPSRDSGARSIARKLVCRSVSRQSALISRSARRSPLPSSSSGSLAASCRLRVMPAETKPLHQSHQSAPRVARYFEAWDLGKRACRPRVKCQLQTHAPQQKALLFDHSSARASRPGSSADLLRSWRRMSRALQPADRFRAARLMLAAFRDGMIYGAGCPSR